MKYCSVHFREYLVFATFDYKLVNSNGKWQLLKKIVYNKESMLN